MGHSHLHTKPSLLKCRSVQRSQILKFTELNDLDSFMTYYIFTDLGPPLCGRGQLGGGYLGAWGGPRCMHTFIHTHMYMLKYTCIEIANGCQHVYHD